MRLEREVLPIMANKGTRLRPKRVPFSGFRCKKGQGFHQLKYKKGKSVIESCERTSDLRANRYGCAKDKKTSCFNVTYSY